MGRFRVASLYDDDDEEDESYDDDPAAGSSGCFASSSNNWEFVAGHPSEEGAIVMKTAEVSSSYSNNSDDRDEWRPRPNNPSTLLRDNDDDDPYYDCQVSNTHHQQQQQLDDDHNNNSFIVMSSRDLREWMLEEQQQQQQNPSSASRTYYKRFLYLSVMIAIVAMLWKDPPPAPPAPRWVTTTAGNAIRSDTPTTTISSEEENDETMSPPGDHDDDLLVVQSRSWNEYLNHHGQQWLTSTLELVWRTPYHMVSWWCTSLYTDLQLYFEKFHKQRKAQLCSSSSVPSCTSAAQYQDTIQQQVGFVGQDVAVQWLSHAYCPWMEQQQSQSPLLIYALGFRHTGKRTLAQALANYYYQTPNCPHNRLLHLEGSTVQATTLNQHPHRRRPYYHDDEEQDQLLLQAMVLAIQNHVDTVGHNAVLLLSDFEQLPSRVMHQLLLALLPHGGQKLKEESPSYYNNDLQEDTLLCRHCIVYLTSSSLGVGSIASHLRQNGGQVGMATTSLVADLREAIRGHYHSDNNKNEEGPLSSSSSSSGGGGPVVDLPSVYTSSAIVLPFVPLTPDAMADLLRLRLQKLPLSLPQQQPPPPPRASTGSSRFLQQPEEVRVQWWKKLVVTDAAAQALVQDPSRVEYLEWRRRQPSCSGIDDEASSPSSLIMKVAVDGAQALGDASPIMIRLGSEIQEWIAEHGAKRSLVAVFDTDDSDQNASSSYSLFASTKRGMLLKWCLDELAMQCQMETLRRFRI